MKVDAVARIFTHIVSKLIKRANTDFNIMPMKSDIRSKYIVR